MKYKKISKKIKKQHWLKIKFLSYNAIFVKKIQNKKVLHQHIKEVHEKKKYKCQYCGFEFAKSGHLSRHMKIHEDEETKSKNKLNCDFCDKTFTRKDALIIFW